MQMPFNLKKSTKRLLLILAVGVVVIMGAIQFFQRSDSPSTKVEFKFLGYRNTDGQMEATFSVQLPSGFRGGGWGYPEVSRQEDGVWKIWTNYTQSRSSFKMFTGPMQTPTTVFSAKRPPLFAAVLVETTNVPSRIIIRMNENPREWPVLAVARELGAKLGLESKPGIDTGRKRGFTYFITNETSVTPLPTDR